MSCGGSGCSLLHEWNLQLVLEPLFIFHYVFEIDSAVLKVTLIKPWVNTIFSLWSTERKVEWQKAGLIFFIVISGTSRICSCFKLTSALSRELFLNTGKHPCYTTKYYWNLPPNITSWTRPDRSSPEGLCIQQMHEGFKKAAWMGCWLRKIEFR